MSGKSVFSKGRIAFALRPGRRVASAALLMVAMLAGACGGGGGDSEVSGDGPGQSPDNDGTGSAATWTRVATDTRFKSGLTSSFAGFGHSVALSEAASTLAVGAISSFLGGSSVEVFEHDAQGQWTGPVRIEHTAGRVKEFGATVLLSRQGRRLLIADYGVDGEQYRDAYGYQTGVANGAVHVYDKTDAGEWDFVASLAAPNPRSIDNFGRSADISASGDLIAVGVPNRDFETLPADPAQLVKINDSGSVFIFSEAAAGQFEVLQQLRAPDPGVNDNFGRVVALSRDGSTLVVSSPGDDSAGSGVVATDALADSSSINSGILHVYARGADGRFALQANLKSSLVDSNPEEVTRYDFQEFGRYLSISDDGNTIVAGATYSIYNDGLVFPPPESIIDIPRGEVTIYQRSGSQWQVSQLIKAPSGERYQGLYGGSISYSSEFGADIALTPGAKTLAVGMTGFSERSDGGSFDAGAIFTYTLDANGQYQPFHSARLPRSNIGELLGNALSFSADGRWLAGGASKENSGGFGVNPAADATPVKSDSGAVYLFDMSRLSAP